MKEKEHKEFITISGLSRILHTDRPQLTRATRDLYPPIELIEGNKIRISDIPRIADALQEMREQKK